MHYPALWRQDIAAATKLVLMAMHEIAEDGMVDSKLEQLGEMCRIKVRTVRWHIQQLKALQMVEQDADGEPYRLVLQDIATGVQDPAVQSSSSLRGGGVSQESQLLLEDPDPSPPPPWLSVFLERDSERWSKANLNGLVEDVEKHFGSSGLNLELEAANATDWLHEKGQRKTPRGMPRFWKGWLTRQLKGYPEDGRRPGSTRPAVEHDRSKGLDWALPAPKDEEM